MQSVDSYLAEVLAAIRPLPPCELGLEEADGTALAGAFDNSAMDGYAVLAADVAAATPEHPVTLPVRGEVAAGDTGRRDLAPGTCIRIMTGALLPSGADAVVPVEWTDAGTAPGTTGVGTASGTAGDGGTGQVTISQAAEPGHAVRRAGGDAAPGDVLPQAAARSRPAPGPGSP